LLSEEKAEIQKAIVVIEPLQLNGCTIDLQAILSLLQVVHSNQFEKCYQAARAGVYPGPAI
jgi:hypothetical protein